MNLNVLSKETLLDAMENPDKYPQLTIRVSGYAVNFVRLTREQQLDVINRSFFHGGALTWLPTDDTPGGAEELRAGNRHDLRHDLSPDAPETDSYAEGEGAFGYVHSYETGSRLDGPGIRVTLFVSGCPLRCLYCHNPDTWHLKHGTRVAAGTGRHAGLGTSRPRCAPWRAG